MLRHSAEECLALADAVLAAVPEGEAEVRVVEDDLALTRFARNTVHQNVAETGLSLRLRLVAGGRIGVAEVRGNAGGSIDRLVRLAEEARRVAPAEDALAPLPAPDGGDGPCGWSDARATSTSKPPTSPGSRSTRSAGISNGTGSRCTPLPRWRTSSGSCGR